MYTDLGGPFPLFQAIQSNLLHELQAIHVLCRISTCNHRTQVHESYAVEAGSSISAEVILSEFRCLKLLIKCFSLWTKILKLYALII
jgi:hypothetical protein